MTLDIIRHRLHNQFLSQTKCTQPAQVVEQLGAVQSQDYAGAKWALAQRLKDATTDAAIDKAFNEGKILRTHRHASHLAFCRAQQISAGC